MNEREQQISELAREAVENCVASSGLLLPGEQVQIRVSVVPPSPPVKVVVKSADKGKLKKTTVTNQPITDEDWDAIMALPLSTSGRVILERLKVANNRPLLSKQLARSWSVIESLNQFFSIRRLSYRVRNAGERGLSVDEMQMKLVHVA